MVDQSIAAHGTRGAVLAHRADAGEAAPAKYFSDLPADEKVMVVRRVESMFSSEYPKDDKAADYSEGQLVWTGLSRYWALPLQLFIAVTLLQIFLLSKEQPESFRRGYEIAFVQVAGFACALFFRSYAWACEHRAGARRVRMWLEFKRDQLQAQPSGGN